MRHRPEKPRESTPAKAMEAALRLLTRRGRSEEELRRALLERQFNPEHVIAVLDRCRELNYLDDRSFALERARSLQRTGKGVGPRIIQRLRQHGIDRELAEHAAREAAEEHSPDAVLEELLQRRFSEFDYARADDRQRRRVIQFFLRRGFALPRILNHLKQER